MPAGVMDRRRCVMSKMITIQIPEGEYESLREEVKNLSVDELLALFALTRDNEVSQELLQRFLDYFLEVSNICVALNEFVFNE